MKGIIHKRRNQCLSNNDKLKCFMDLMPSYPCRPVMATRTNIYNTYCLIWRTMQSTLQ